MYVVWTCRDLSSQLLKLCCKFRVLWVGLEEFNNCLKSLLHEDQGLCERQNNIRSGGKNTQDK